MLFKETLEKWRPYVEKAVAELFDADYANQLHEQDLLLMLENGTYQSRDIDVYKNNNLSPYVVGPQDEGHNNYTQFRFYDNYRNSALFGNRRGFLDDVQQQKPGAEELEYASIHLELMIYLKFFESDYILKQLFELTNLALSKPYDWRFDTNNFKNRYEIVACNIRDPIETVCPSFYDLMLKTYRGQIRNAIAHSQFAFLGRYIHLNNRHLSPHYKLDVITFEEWEEMIHIVILFQNEIIRQEIRYKNIYKEKSSLYHYGLQLKLEEFPDGSMKTQFYKYYEDKNYWNFYDNEKR
ncbi:MAG: hypothetical protein JST75_17270 [Bacteroidetes bacterium]|nr:hypothetical protein [Bacteroidota bacterium]